MVTPSRPVELAQTDVDALVRGHHEPAVWVRRAASADADAASDRVEDPGSRPVAVTPAEMASIVRSGRPSATTARRIAEATRPATAAATKRGRGDTADGTSAPSLAPPNPG